MASTTVVLLLTSGASAPLFLPSTFSTTARSSSPRLGHGRCPVPAPHSLHWKRPARGSTCRWVPAKAKAGGGKDIEEEEDATNMSALLQNVLWGVEATYIVWLLLLPYAPGDPVWAISPATVADIINLSLNFFLILPIANSVGVHIMEAPLLHPASEGLFNFVLGWTLLFAPLLFTDHKRGRFKGSLEILWGMQMFLTNVFLIPYMAIRLNNFDTDVAKSTSSLASAMTRGANIVATVGGSVCLLSILWFAVGRADAGYGGLMDRWEYLKNYVGSERLAYAFIWDIILYAIFQPWLIGDNIENLKESSARTVSTVRFIPVVGLVAYLLNLDKKEEV